MLLSTTAYINNCLLFCHNISTRACARKREIIGWNGTALHEIAYVLSKLKVTFVFSKYFHSYSTFKHSLTYVHLF